MIENATNSSGPIAVEALFATQVIALTTSLIEPSSVTIGDDNRCFLIAKCQPSTASTDTAAIASGAGGK